MNRVTMGVLSMIRVFGNIPIIRAPSGGAAEMLAMDVCSALRESLSPRGAAYSLFADAVSASAAPVSSSGVSPRPLLLIVDRTSDMIPSLMHTSTYQALIDDLIGLHLNKVTVASANVKDKGGKKSYDLNTQSDAFFAQYAGAPFPEAVEANDQKTAEVSLKEQEIRSRPTGASAVAGGGAAPVLDMSSTKDAIDSLPELMSKKANLETHTTILKAALTEISTRDIPTFFEVELAMTTSGRVDKAAVLSILRDGAKGTVQDKARLLAVVALILSGDSSSAGRFDEYESAFTQGCAAIAEAKAAAAAATGVNASSRTSANTGGDTDTALATRYLAAVSFIRRLQSLQAPLSQRLMGSGGTSGAIFTSLLTTAQSRASSLMAKATSFFAKFSPMQVTRITEALAEGRACQENDTYVLLDPRKSAVGAQAPESPMRFADVIVFVVGGGCYAEYFNLMELVKQKQANPGGLRNVYYGCTELLSGGSFMAQLEQLGSPP